MPVVEMAGEETGKSEENACLHSKRVKSVEHVAAQVVDPAVKRQHLISTCDNKLR